MVRKKLTPMTHIGLLQSALEEKGYSVFSKNDGKLHARKIPYHFIFEKDTKKGSMLVSSHIDVTSIDGHHRHGYAKGTENRLKKEYKAILNLYFLKRQDKF